MSTKEKVLNILVSAKATTEENALSGEKLAGECGVSRAAIWKAVNALRNDGLCITGTPNGGYFLCDDDVFTQELFVQTIAEKFPQFSGCDVEVFKEIDSTNSYAKRILAECGSLRDDEGNLTESGKRCHKAIICAESQTNGRGRLGRTFYSPAKTGIYLSIIYAPKGGITNPARLTAFSAVAVKRAIFNLYKINPQIKWINDLYINGKKICGILTEGSTNFETGQIESAVIGIGINIKDNPDVFPPELLKVAGSIEGKNEKLEACKPGPGRCLLAVNVAAEVLKVLEEDAESVMKEYREASFLIGKTLQIHPIIGDDKSTYQALAVDIDQNAALVVELADGTRRALSSGEVTLHAE